MRERIRRERKVRDLTQKSLAEALSLSEIFVRKIEKGDSDPGRKTMKNIKNSLVLGRLNCFRIFSRNLMIQNIPEGAIPMHKTYTLLEKSNA